MTDDRSPRAEGVPPTDGASEGRYSRRRVLQGLGAGASLGLAGCTGPSGINPREVAAQSGGSGAVAGTVRDLDGAPIAEASVTALGEGSTRIDDAATDREGRFRLDCDRPAWLRIEAPDYLPRTVAVEPGADREIRLSPAEGTVSLAFGGDVMFGRRFYDPPDDPLGSRFEIDPDDRLASHRELLGYVGPLLETADVTSVNLETPLTTSEWRHPEKTHTYASHPVAARALADVGVDHAALGNNHVFDALNPGFEDTLETLDAAGLAYSGAGRSSDEAWEPAVVGGDGPTVAQLSCSTYVGDSFAVDWSADRTGGERTVRRGDETLAVPSGWGVAEPTVDRLRDRVRRADGRADVVVVQLHGGEQYGHQPSDRLRELAAVASDAGADIVVNHQPHVTGGLEFQGSTLVAWTLGNLVFDQELWETLRSYVLTVDVGPEGVRRASVEPVVLDGYVPKGVTGEPRGAILRETAGLSSETFSLRGSALDAVAGASTEPRTETVEFDGEGSIYARESGWIGDLETDGTARLGRDRLPTGQFEESTVDEERAGGLLWRYGRGSTPTIPPSGVEGNGSARLSRHVDNTQRKALTPRHRLPIREGTFTFTGRYRFNGEAGAELLVAWYDDGKGESFAGERYDLSDTGREWRRLTRHLDAPERATHVDVFAFLSPPERSDILELDLDDLRLIEWADGAVTGGREYDHLLAEGAVVARLAASPRDGAGTADWSELET
jgi:poly-gamma-glutamate capsule biosynthesis protein CapA/YwtB (metallophosphatase superfamily)